MERVNGEQLKELKVYRDEIKKLKPSREIEDELRVELSEDEEVDSDLKAFIQTQISDSEARINTRLDNIDKKLNLLLSKLIEDYQESEQEDPLGEDEIQEEHIIEYVHDIEEQATIVDEYSSQLFPITEEEFFDYFMNRLKDETYRQNLVNARWELAKHVGSRSFNVSVKNFLVMHFDLEVCVKYSVSGYGSRGSRKKKLDAPTLVKYVYECFNRVNPNVHSYQEVSKAITSYWGRSQDNLTKIIERTVKRESNPKRLELNFQ